MSLLLKVAKGDLREPDNFEASEQFSEELQQQGTIEEIEQCDAISGTGKTVKCEGEEVRFECRGTGLENKLAQLSVSDGDLLLVRLRRKRPEEKKRKYTEEKHQEIVQVSHY